ncbi:MAG: ribosomal protein S18-alanine N-acetyltransferase [Oscillospiraceae bacterium]
MDFQIVDARPEHIPQIEAIEKICFSLPWTRQMLESQLDGGSHLFLAAVSGERVLGYVGLMFVLDEGYISNVAVAPAHRRQGVAHGLLTALEERSRAKGLAFLTLEVRAGNAPAIALYEKHGYRPVGRRKNYYDRPREDAVLMTLEF